MCVFGDLQIKTKQKNKTLHVQDIQNITKVIKKKGKKDPNWHLML